ncbi:MAG: PilZ domain-containing protein [Oscillospiraceae bacterium]|nr:PilZ domain-containing protein [Oscillospiraceae bacterium]
MRFLIKKENIIKLEVRDLDGAVLHSTQSFEFARDFFGIAGKEFIVIKGKNLPSLPKGEMIDAIFYYRNGTRVKIRTGIDVASDQQMNFHIGNDYIVMEERRNSFKVYIDISAKISSYKRNEDIYDFGPPPLEAVIKNINIGGIFFNGNYSFAHNDIVTISFIRDDFVVDAKILRIQRDEAGNVMGYGCCFDGITQQQEQIISKFIFECQLAEREKEKGRF